MTSTVPSNTPLDQTAPLEPFSGRWVFAAGESTWLGPTPSLWVQEITCAAGRVRVRECITSASGEQTDVVIDAAFDGQEYPVSGSPYVDTIAYTRPEPSRIEGIARKGSRVAFREAVAVTPERERLIVALTISSADGRTLAGTAVFLRDSDRSAV